MYFIYANEPAHETTIQREIGMEPEDVNATANPSLPAKCTWRLRAPARRRGSERWDSPAGEYLGVKFHIVQSGEYNILT